MPTRTFVILAISLVLAFACLALVTHLLSGGGGASSIVWAIAGAVSLFCLAILSTSKSRRDCQRNDRPA